MAWKPSANPAGNLAFPYRRHLKSSSPQMPVQDNETKAGIFPGKVIIVSGKIAMLGDGALVLFLEGAG